LLRLVPLKEGARLRGVSVDTLIREGARGKIEIVDTSERRKCIRLGDALGITK
jgi:hypothetical protein